MRIAYDHQIFSIQEYGGVSRYFFELAKHTSANEKHEVTVISPFYVNQYLRNSEKIRIWGLKTPFIPKTGRFLGFINNLSSNIH